MEQVMRLHEYAADLAKPLQRYNVGYLAQGDKFADEFRFILQEHGKEVYPSTIMTVTAYFMQQNGNTVLLEGVHSGSIVSVTLNQLCYSCEGRFTLTVRATGWPNASTTLAMIDGFVRKTTTDDLVMYIGDVPKPEDFFSDNAVGEAVNGYLSRNPIQLVPVFAQSKEECTDTSLAYVLPDGYVYAYMWSLEGLPDIIIEEGTGGYWYSDKWNAGGAWTANSECCSKRTSVFSVTPGDIITYQGHGTATVQSVCWLDSSQAFLSEEYASATAAGTTFTAPANAAYAWLQSFAYVTGPSGVILNVGFEKYEGSTKGYHWTNTGHKFVAGGEDAALSDVLSGKKIVYDGDSIAESRANNGGGYAQIIADMVGGVFDNQAVGGGRLTAISSRHSVVNNLANLPLDGDLYCFEGGINDYWGDVPIGECIAGDYTGALDTGTICGALETIFRYCLNTFVGKPVCFVIVHKVQETGHQINGKGNTFKDYRDAMVMVCGKYSIPYYDAFMESGLNGWNAAQSAAYLTANGNGTADGTHPNEEGYKRYYVPQLLALFRSMMKV